MMQKFYIVGAAATALSGCASSSALPLNQNTIQMTAAAAPLCGALGAQRVALKSAAIETIRRGFQRFQIFDALYQNNIRSYGSTPLVANTHYGGGVATTYFSGGQPIIGGNHLQRLVVRMYRPGDSGYHKAIDAKTTLGKDWKKAVKGGVSTC